MSEAKPRYRVEAEGTPAVDVERASEARLVAQELNQAGRSAVLIRLGDDLCGRPDKLVALYGVRRDGAQTALERRFVVPTGSFERVVAELLPNLVDCPPRVNYDGTLAPADLEAALSLGPRGRLSGLAERVVAASKAEETERAVRTSRGRAIVAR